MASTQTGTNVATDAAEGAVTQKESTPPTTPRQKVAATNEQPVATLSPHSGRGVKDDVVIVVGYCSWCCNRTSHDRIETNIFRDVYQCSECHKRTLQCVSHLVVKCHGMSRGHASGDDKRCLICRRLFATWDEARADPGQASFARQARCSWCFNETRHEMVEEGAGLFGGDVYECGGCRRRTKVCTKCKSAHAPGEGIVNSMSCAVCSKFVDSWDDVQANNARMTRKGHCSWCYDLTTHRMEQFNSVRRHVFACQSCHARTLRCYRCDVGMTRGGATWDDKLCAQCEGDQGIKLFGDDSNEKWAQMLQRKREMYIRGWHEEEVRSELERKSPQRAKAHAEGVLRPFLLLVSMSPAMRNQIAGALGWSLLREPFWGDSHAESWCILNRNMHGLQARSNELKETLNPMAKNANWYEMLRRSNIGLVAGVMPRLTQSESLVEPPLDEIEIEILGRMHDMHRARMAADVQEQVNSIMDSAIMVTLRARLAANGIRTMAVQQFALESIVVALLEEGVSIDAEGQTHDQQLEAVWSLIRRWLIWGDCSERAVIETQTTRSRNSVGTGPSAAVVAGSIVGGPFFLVGAAWFAADAVRAAFGSSALRIAPVIGQLLMHRLLLALQGTDIDDFVSGGRHELHGHRIAVRDGRWLSYEEYGDPGGMPVFVFHSLLSSRLERHPDDRIATSNGVRLITVDRPGYGRSDPVAERTYQDFANDIADLADVLGIRRFACLGFSSGGPYVYAVCAIMPQRVLAASVVSSDAPYAELEVSSLSDVNKALWYMSRNDTARKWMLKPTLWAFYQTCHTDPHGYLKDVLGGDEYDAAIAQIPAIGELIVVATREGCLQGVDAAVQDIVMERRDWGFSLRQVRCLSTIQIWHGAEDSQLDPALAKFSAGLLPDCELHIISGESHHSLYFKQWDSILQTLQAQAIAAQQMVEAEALSVSGSGSVDDAVKSPRHSLLQQERERLDSGTGANQWQSALAAPTTAMSGALWRLNVPQPGMTPGSPSALTPKATFEPAPLSMVAGANPAASVAPHHPHTPTPDGTAGVVGWGLGHGVAGSGTSVNVVVANAFDAAEAWRNKVEVMIGTANNDGQPEHYTVEDLWEGPTDDDGVVHDNDNATTGVLGQTGNDGNDGGAGGAGGADDDSVGLLGRMKNGLVWM